MKSKVYVKFPKAGLGNKLLTWSRGYVYSQLNGLELHTSSWFSFFIGAWLRRENKKRIYFGYFRHRNLTTTIRFFIYQLLFKKVEEPGIDTTEDTPSNTLFIFNKTFREYDFFKEVRPYKALVKQGLFDMLAPLVKEAYEKAEKPAIGIHVRRGDFKIANPITPIEFFIEAINEIRKQAGEDLPVTIFTDADKEEIKCLLDLPKAMLAEPQADIVDILLLASSRYLLTSISSTFSYWAAFLSEGIIIKPPTEWHVPLRAETDRLYGNEIKWPGFPITPEVESLLKSDSQN